MMGRIFALQALHEAGHYAVAVAFHVPLSAVQIVEGVGAVTYVAARNPSTWSGAFVSAVLSCAGWIAEERYKPAAAATVQNDREKFHRAAAYIFPRDRELQRQFRDQAEDSARRIVRKHWDGVCQLAELLTRRGYVNGVEAKRILCP